MKTLQVGELKRRFSEVLESIRNGDEIAITFGRKKERVAVIVPIEKYQRKAKRRLGLGSETGSCVIHDDFEMSDDEFLMS